MTDAEITATLVALERRRRDALVGDDMALLATLVADDVVHVHTTGVVQDKQALLNHAGSFLKFREVERSDLTVRVLAPDVAVMTGHLKNTVGRRGTDEVVEVNAFVTQVWAERQGAWQIVSFHATRIGSP